VVYTVQPRFLNLKLPIEHGGSTVVKNENGLYTYSCNILLIWIIYFFVINCSFTSNYVRNWKNILDRPSKCIKQDSPQVTRLIRQRLFPNNYLPTFHNQGFVHELENLITNHKSVFEVGKGIVKKYFTFCLSQYYILPYRLNEYIFYCNKSGYGKSGEKNINIFLNL